MMKLFFRSLVPTSSMVTAMAETPLSVTVQFQSVERNPVNQTSVPSARTAPMFPSALTISSIAGMSARSVRKALFDEGFNPFSN